MPRSRTPGWFFRTADLWVGSLRRWWRSRRGGGHTALGRRGERVAAKFLRRRGYRIVSRGKRSGYVEIDIIAVDRRTVVFVEVKTRSTLAAGDPAEAVDLERQKRMTRGATAFLKFHDLLEYAARFDVIAIHWPPGSRQPKIEHIENAFEAVGVDGMFT